MKTLGKKGSMSTVQMLLLFLAVTIVLTLFFIPFISWAGETSDKEACRLSVMAKYGGKQAKLGVSESSVALQCFTQELTITSEGIYKKGKDRKERQVESFPSYSGAGGKSKLDITYERQELVKEAIANEMYDCWDQFWQGKLSIFTSGDRCVICSDINFDTDWIDTEGIGEQGENARFVNLGQYLNTKKINKEQTYSDFFGGQFEPGFTINTKVDNKITFKSISQSWLSKWIDLTVFGCIQGLTGLTGGLITSAYQDTNAPISRTVIAAGAALPIPGGGCAWGFVVGAIHAKSEGSTWVPSMFTGPSAMIAEQCDKLY